MNEELEERATKAGMILCNGLADVLTDSIRAFLDDNEIKTVEDFAYLQGMVMAALWGNIEALNNRLLLGLDMSSLKEIFWRIERYDYQDMFV